MPADRLIAAFDNARKNGRVGFIPYITAGDPDLAACASVVDALSRAGADVIELGVPFSDPIADGPINQRAAERALASGTTLDGILNAVASMRKDGRKIPIVLFTYFNPIHKMGVDVFCRRAAEAGVDGALIVDLPPEEAGEYRTAAKAADIGAVFLASPTTTDERLALIGEASTGFVYYVSRMGVTGVSASISASLEEELARVKKITHRPVAVGFGISTPEQAAFAAKNADAVVVGSALVRMLAEDGAGGISKMEKLAAGISKALRKEKA